MKSHLIIQARMGSSRLPGKTLTAIKDRPVLGHLLDSVREVFEAEEITVVTTLGALDEAIVEFCATEGIAVIRGDEANVASRFVEVIWKHSALTHFVRVSGDSPLLDYRVIESCIEFAKDADFDLVTTAQHRSFPSGCNVEVVKCATFLDSYSQFKTPEHFEHVTKFFYEQSPQFAIKGLESGIRDPGHYKFSVDTAEDLERITKLFQAFTKPHHQYSLSEKCQLSDKLALFQLL